MVRQRIHSPKGSSRVKTKTSKSKKNSSGPRYVFTLRYTALVISLIVLYLTPLWLIFILPSLQAQIVFMPMVSWPLFLNLSDPSSVGLQSTRNIYIESENYIKLGTWHTLPKSIRNTAQSESNYDESLASFPTVLYVHGNAGTRGGYHRVQLCKLLSDLNLNVISFDYRGFGDSTNERPTASGLITDSKAVYQWIKARSKNKQPLFVWGHSMGTAVTSRFVAELAEKGEKATGVVLESGFNNVKMAMSNYPLSRIYNYLPFFEYLLDHIIKTQDLDFVSDERVKKIKTPLLMLHAADDNTVKIQLGRLLKDAAQSSRPTNSYFKYIEFEANNHYGHKYIFREPSLPKIIIEFINASQTSN